MAGLHKQLSELYKPCECCGGLQLSDKNKKQFNKIPDNINKAFNIAVKYIHKKGGFDNSMLFDEPINNLTYETYKEIKKGVDFGLTDNLIPPEMLAYLKNDVFVFSGGKTYAELKELSNLLLDENGKVKPLYKFALDVKPINENYNLNYLESEYLFAVDSAQMCAKWVDFEKTANRYNLQYRTAGDDKVRASHVVLSGVTLPQTDAFWNEYFPPNGWRCRCNVVQIRAGKYPLTNSQAAIKNGEKATSEIDKNGVNRSEMFRFNAGKQRVIFPPHHPYYTFRDKVNTAKKETIKPKSKPVKETKPPANNNIINIVDYIKGEIPTSREVENILKAYADKFKDDFRGGIAAVKITNTNSYMMQHSMFVNRLTGDWHGGSTISISNKYFGAGVFNPANELKGAFAAIKKGENLTFTQEYAVESLWHEILHAKTKGKPQRLTSGQLQALETVNQFCARHTYDTFLERLGGKSTKKDEVIKNGFGYSTWVREFRERLENDGITEEKALSVLMPKLLGDDATMQTEIMKFINDNKKTDTKES